MTSWLILCVLKDAQALSLTQNPSSRQSVQRLSSEIACHYLLLGPIQIIRPGPRGPLRIDSPRQKEIDHAASVERRNQIWKQASDTHDWGVLVPACRRDLVTSGLICWERQQNFTWVAEQISFHMNALWNTQAIFTLFTAISVSLYRDVNCTSVIARK